MKYSYPKKCVKKHKKHPIDDYDHNLYQGGPVQIKITWAPIKKKDKIIYNNPEEVSKRLFI